MRQRVPSVAFGLFVLTLPFIPSCKKVPVGSIVVTGIGETATAPVSTLPPGWICGNTRRPQYQIKMGASAGRVGDTVTTTISCVAKTGAGGTIDTLSLVSAGPATGVEQTFNRGNGTPGCDATYTAGPGPGGDNIHWEAECVFY